MSEFDAIIDYVEQSCKTRGKKLTPKRKLVLQTLLHANKALSAYELLDYCQTHFKQAMQVMTIYRTLDFLEQELFVHKLTVSNQYVVCWHILCEDEHGTPQFLICAKCNKINEQIIDPQMMIGLKSNAQQEGFTVVNSQIEINDICDQCVE
ncbi:Fur family transcriptional regulator [Psychromonas sp. GE-S-Ul-11]|uniref:Fur family transcriptional regulator n=1 Tax=Psychromonas sp. GE-S-Ul-11 TaxID=3241170 RepID=UPI00390C5162